MRIIGGANRGTKLKAPSGLRTRPTSDRAREALFNVLIHNYPEDIADAHVLDVFAGSGTLGLEALSRGAQSLTFIEHDKAALDSIKSNIEFCHAEQKTRIVAGNALQLPKATWSFNLIFIDPPYHQNLIGPALKELHSKNWVADGALIVMETGPGDKWLLSDVPLEILDRRKWGKAEIHFLRYGVKS